MCARSNAPAMARPPSSIALSEEREPESFPIGVRAPATITDPGIVDLPSSCSWLPSKKPLRFRRTLHCARRPRSKAKTAGVAVIRHPRLGSDLEACMPRDMGLLTSPRPRARPAGNSASRPRRRPFPHHRGPTPFCRRLHLNGPTHTDLRPAGRASNEQIFVSPSAEQDDHELLASLRASMPEVIVHAPSTSTTLPVT